MDYNKIVSVTGLPGLFELISSRADGAVVKALEDGTSKFVSTRQHQFSHLESIEVYSLENNNTLAELFSLMKKNDEKVPDEKASSEDLKKYFEKINAQLDPDRVYTSDMKKMVKWYHILTKNKIEIVVKTEEEKEAAADKNQKPIHTGDAHVKDMKPQQTNPRKIESRGVK